MKMTDGRSEGRAGIERGILTGETSVIEETVIIIVVGLIAIVTLIEEIELIAIMIVEMTGLSTVIAVTAANAMSIIIITIAETMTPEEERTTIATTRTLEEAPAQRGIFVVPKSITDELLHPILMTH